MKAGLQSEDSESEDLRKLSYATLRHAHIQARTAWETSNFLDHFQNFQW